MAAFLSKTAIFNNNSAIQARGTLFEKLLEINFYYAKGYYSRSDRKHLSYY